MSRPTVYHLAVCPHHTWRAGVMGEVLKGDTVFAIARAQIDIATPVAVRVGCVHAEVEIFPSHLGTTAMLDVFEGASLVLKATSHAILDDDRVEFPIGFNQELGASALRGDLLALKPRAPIEGITVSWFLLDGVIRCRSRVVGPGASNWARYWRWAWCRWWRGRW